MRYTLSHKRWDCLVKRKHYIGIRSKIILYTILCVVAVGLISNFFLYAYMQAIIEEKVQSIDNLNAGIITNQLDNVLEQALTLDYYCTNSNDVMEALRRVTLDDLPSRNAALTAQDAMSSYLRTSTIDSYINKLLIFNETGVFVHAVTTYSGSTQDLQNVMASEQFRRYKSGDWEDFDRLYPSVRAEGGDCLVLLSAVYRPNSYVRLGYVYIELDPRIVTDVLAPYNLLNRYFVQTSGESYLMPAQDAGFLAAIPSGANAGKDFRYDGDLYSIEYRPLETASLTLSSCINQTALKASDQDVLFSVITVVLMIIFIAAAILVLLTHYITTPISRIMEKINKIALNDYSFDPELERPNNEIGEIGARLNELGMGFEKLLEETIALHDERSEIEMALLQSQVNPHFLYNTLNSVHWMAVMQKNPGIEKIVRSLVNLLKNLSKGVSAKIPLTEELSLLNDYINIQSIRYMGAFEYICNVPEALRGYKIIKFTLQPLVENAIFHGVIPKGTFGTITVDAYEEEHFLVITITDDGVGMTAEEAEALLKSEDRIDRSSMSGIGVANVNKRLKLAYGRGAGLSVESVKGAYTKVSVRIAKDL